MSKLLKKDTKQFLNALHNFTIDTKHMARKQLLNVGRLIANIMSI